MQTFRLALSIAEPGRNTTFACHPDGSLQAETVSAEGKARKWRYTYNAHGQIKTVTNPRTDIVARDTHDYDADGNISTVTNAAGQKTTFSNYDANGRVGRIVDRNGLTTDLLYSERGWLTSSTVSGLVTTYTYDRVGQLRQVVAPGNVIVNYNYDAAHRLTGMADVLGNAISYTLDLRGNRLAEKVTDPVGDGSAEVSRT